MADRHTVRCLAVLLIGAGCARSAPEIERIRPGIDVLLADSIHLVTGRRVGVLTNQTGIDVAGVDDITRLRDAGIRLTAIFSPEHGFRGVLDQENIGHGIDSATGLPIFSLYGATREPTPAMLSEVDVVLIDLQDIGGRPYTYISTVLRTLRATGAAGVDVIVLDRPNPVGGVQVQGPVLEDAFASWVGMLPVPLRHGMTLGELARLGNAELEIAGQLIVVPVAGWRRSMWFDDLGVPWVAPSPNMPDLESATHYPGIVLFERTNLSVARGTPIAFQAVAAPWLDAPAVARAVRDQPGVAVIDTTITPRGPTDGKYGGMAIPAVRFRVADRSVYDPTAFAVRLLTAIQRRHADVLTISVRGFDERAGTDALRLAIRAGDTWDDIVRSWEPALAAFRERRRGYLLYR